MNTAKTCGVALAGAALLAAASTQAIAKDYDVGTGPVTIQMKLKGKKPYFSGPKTVSKGAKMTIVNKTAPKKIGGHTFSLVKPALVPKSKVERKACFDGHLCLTIAIAHQFDEKTMKVNKSVVDVGKKGWDTSFGKTGDTWYTEEQGGTTSRKVTAKVGTTLTYFCAVHPGMKGKIKVVK